MKSFFSMDAPLFRILSTLYDLIILNLVTLAGCLPILTAGASLTAMHFVLLALVRDEEPDIVRSWFRSLRENLRQSTVIWCVYLSALLVYFWTCRGGADGTPGSLAVSCIWAVLFLLFLLSLYLFPFLAHFRNTILRSIGICAALTVAYLFRTAGMAVTHALWLGGLLSFLPRSIPLVVLFGLSLPGYFCALLYNPVFRRLEGPTDSADENQETTNNL